MSGLDKWVLFLDFKDLCEKTGMEKSEMVKQVASLESELWGGESIEINGDWN